jgi:iron(III) transport system substrate-binding protein
MLRQLKILRRCVTGTAAGALALAAVVALPAADVAEAAELVIYSAGNPEGHKLAMDAFRKAHPGIKVSEVTESTGTVSKRVIAEKDNPQADIIMAINTFYMDLMKDAGVLEPYEPANTPVPEDARDPDGFYLFESFGIYGFVVNKEMLKEKNLPMPNNWDDLINPIYKGHLSIASPIKSGTGLTIFSTLVDTYGWNFLDNLHENIFQYNSSGSAAARQAGRGEITIGLSYGSALKQQVDAGRPVVMVIPSLVPNVGLGQGLIAGAPNPEEAKIFIDWLLSEEAAPVREPYAEVHSIPGYGWLPKAGIDLSNKQMWSMRRPLDVDEFKRAWAKRFEK